MKAFTSQQKHKSSVKDCLRKYKQRSNLLLISFHLKRYPWQKTEMLTLFCKYILQRRQGQFWGIHFFNSRFELLKVSIFLSQEAVIPKFLDLNNSNFQGLCKLILLLMQQNLNCFLIYTWVVYLLESIP